jgi:hypothetical protein
LPFGPPTNLTGQVLHQLPSFLQKNSMPPLAPFRLKGCQSGPLTCSLRQAIGWGGTVLSSRVLVRVWLFPLIRYFISLYVKCRCYWLDHELAYSGDYKVCSDADPYQASLDVLSVINYTICLTTLVDSALQWDPMSLLQDLCAQNLRSLSRPHITIHTPELNVTDCAPVYVEAPPTTYGT